MSDAEQQPSEALQAEYGDGGVEGGGEEAPQGDLSPVEQQGPSSQDINNPNSDHWKDQAKAQGWDESFEGDPDSGKFQKTAREFVNDGKMIHQLSSLRKDQQRMEDNFNRKNESDLSLQKAAHEGRIADLEAQRNEAIDEADRDTAGAIQDKIDVERNHLSNIPDPKPAAPAYVQNPPQLIAYEANNTWAKDLNDPAAPNYGKAKYADQIYSQAIMQNRSVDDAIAIMDQAVKAQFPQRNANRGNAPVGEGASRPSGGGRGAQALTYDQFSREEQHQVDLVVDNRMYTKEEAVKQINKYRQEA